jgi:glycopeptide antibiotics resistance protein
MDHLIDWGRGAVRLFGAASILALAVSVALVLWRSRSASPRVAVASTVVDVALVLSLIAIGVAGLRPGIGLPGGFEQWNFVPFRDLARAIDGRPWGLGPAVVGVVGNLVLFIPWGFFYALRFRSRSWRTLLVVTVAIAVGVELWQAVTATGRSSDVTDIVVNTAGGLGGYALGRVVARPAARHRSSASASVPVSPTPSRDP